MTDQPHSEPLSWTPPPPGEAHAKAALTRTGAERLAYIDVLRGFVILLMVLDHVREYFSAQALVFEPTDLAHASPALFMARWITHLCAPTFVFLAGASAFLQRGGKSRAELVRYLFTRGLWLVFLELTVVTFGFNFAEPCIFMQVIWAIGFGMILLSALVWLPPPAVLALGAAIVAGHGLLGAVKAADLGAAAPVWQLMMQPGPLTWAPGLIAYPAIPWFGVLCLGYGVGFVFQMKDDRRRLVLMLLGLGFLAAFAALRLYNHYGDPAPWSVQKDHLTTAMSFLKVSKYPPSLDYVLVTLGVALLVGLWLETLKQFTERLLLAFGRTPLFTYLVHIFLIHGLAVLVGMSRGIPPQAFTHFLLEGPQRLAPHHWGFGLGMVVFFWLLVVAILYPISRGYMRLKQEKRAPWMSYL